MHFKIIVPMYNVENCVETNIKSVVSQDYSNFQCVIIDDMSTDNSFDLVNEMIKDDKRFLLIKNKEKKYGLRNIYEAINESNPNDEDVIITLDGDDWFCHNQVLTKLKSVYQTSNCLMTYGNHINYPDGQPCWNLFRYPQNIIDTNSFREYRFLASHLRTFKYKLWNKIDVLSLKGKDKTTFYRNAWDLAMMYPMLEMCGNKFEFISEPLYIYNNQNPLNEYKINHEAQLNEDKEIRTLKKYKVEF